MLTVQIVTAPRGGDEIVICECPMVNKLQMCVVGWRQAYSRAAIHHSSCIGTLLQQQSFATQVSPNYKGVNRPAIVEEKSLNEEKVAPVVYEGVMADTLRRVKILSLTTCCLSVAGPTLLPHLLHFLSLICVPRGCYVQICLFGL